MRSRPLRAALTTAALGLLLTGCGGTSGVHSTAAQPQATHSLTTSVSATPSAGAAKDAPISALRADMLAAAGVLKAADLPGYTVESRGHDSKAVTEETRERYRCMNKPAPSYLLRGQGSSFVKGVQHISSTVDVLTTIQSAVDDVRTYATPSGQQCLRGGLRGDLERLGWHVDDLTFTADVVQVRGADEAVRTRTSYSLTAPGTSMRIEQVGITAVVAGAQVLLVSSSDDGSQPALEPLMDLAALAVARVRTAAAS